MRERAASAWEDVKVADLIERHFCGPSPDCEERPVFDAAEWGVLKTTAITWSGWNQDAHKVLPRAYWGRESIEVKTGDVLVTKAGPRHRVAVVTYVPATRRQLVVSGKMIGLRPRIDLVLPEVLAGLLALRAPQKYINDRTTGMAESQVNFANDVLLDTPLRLPPRAEQTEIARIVRALDTAIRQTEAIIEKLKQVKQGLLHDLLTRGIDANGELRPPQSKAPHLYKDSPLGWIPTEWEVAPLLSRIDLPQGQVDPRSAPYCDWVLIAPDHVESTTGRLLVEVTAKEQGAISGKYVCSPGDVIYSKIRPYLRKATIAREHALCSADMYPFTPHDEVSSQYLLSLLLGERFSRFADSVSMRTGMPKINREELAECAIAWPSRGEQDAVVAVLNSADQKQEVAVVERDKLARLKSGLMDDLLTGRVRVTPLLFAATGA